MGDRLDLQVGSGRKETASQLGTSSPMLEVKSTPADMTVSYIEAIAIRDALEKEEKAIHVYLSACAQASGSHTNDSRFSLEIESSARP